MKYLLLIFHTDEMKLIDKKRTCGPKNCKSKGKKVPQIYLNGFFGTWHTKVEPYLQILHVCLATNKEKSAHNYVSHMLNLQMS